MQQLAPRNPTPEDWRSLLALALYRLVLLIGLLILEQGGYGADLFGELLPRTFRYACIAYAMAALLLIAPVLYRTPRLAVQTHLHFGVDVLGVTALVYASGGVPNGLGVLLVLPALVCGLLLRPRLAVVQAAGATLAMLGEELLRQSTIGFVASEFAQTGLLGLMYFATSFAGSTVAARARQSEQLAQKVGSEFADLSRLNENILESMQAGVVVVDAQGIVRTANRAAQRLLGREQLTGQALAATAPALAEAQTDWTAWRPYAQTLRAHEQAPEVTPRFARLGFAAEPPVLILLDDAGLLKAQAQQMKLAALGRLSASIAHEIRNPLAAITHAGQLLAETSTLGHEDQRLLGMIQRHGARINQIVKDVLDLSKREAVAPERLRLGEWLPRVRAQYLEAYPAAGRELSLLEAQAEVLFDPNHLQQVLFNLWDNSFDHGGTRVLLHTGVGEDGRAYLECADNGPGIGVELTDKVFEPFFTTSSAGTGLGLYLARELCEVNRAQLKLMPTAQGACLRIVFAGEALT